MAQIVLGIGTSHSPLLALEATEWSLRSAEDMANPALNLSDGTFVPYEALLERTGPRYAEDCTIENLSRQQRQAQSSLDRLAGEIEEARPDAVIIIGDDHEEMFSRHAMPSVALYCGATVDMHTWMDTFANAPRWLSLAIEGYAMEKPHRFAGAPELANELVAGLMDRGVDLSVASVVEDPSRAGLGHAFGFVIKRLFGGRDIPVVPLLVNTYYPPNVLRPDRCYELGVKLRQAIAQCASAQRVAIVCSGGLSHFVTDAALDRLVLDAIRTKDSGALRGLPMGALNSGSSEILCWVMAAGALEELDNTWCDYVPVYRTAAGTGIGLAFAAWRPRA
jgi:aromatic ring-opening dioxygenase catalytic subunit (LigB family)